MKILRTAQVPVGDLNPYPGNPRNGDIELIAESLRAHGQYRALVVRDADKLVLAGNHTLHAAHEVGFKKVLCHLIECDDDEAKRIVLVDNRSNDVAGYDDAQLAQLLQSLEGDFSGTGWDEEGLDKILSQLERDSGGKRENTEPGEPPEEPVTQPGELIELGEHRLLCGDATDPEAVKKLLGARTVPTVVMTDPPYGVNYAAVVESRENQKQGGWEDLQGDDLDDEQLHRLVHDALALAPAPILFVWHPSNRVEVFLSAVRDSGWKPAQQIVWVKNALVFGRADYQWRHEPCIYARRDKGGGVEDRTQTTVWEFDKPRSEAHPTSKPTGLYETAYRNHSSAGDLVYDPFAGSGPAVIAAENLGRRAYMMEIDPRYCDVIRERYARHVS